MKRATFSFLAGRKLRAHYYRFAGVRLQDLITVNVANADEVARRYSKVTAHTFVESGPTAFNEATHLPEDELAIIRPFSIGSESVILELAEPQFSFRNHLLLDGDLNVLGGDLATRADLLAFREYAPTHVLKLRGTVAYLSNTWVDNYYHWMQLTLPLIRLYKKFNSGAFADYYYIGESRLEDIQRETLERLGIAPGKIVRQACRGDRLIAGIVLHRPQHAGARYRDVWGHQFVRELFPLQGNDADYPKRIYVKRGDARTRRILNEPALSQYLESLGFISISLTGKSVAEQARIFGNAEFIIGPHGAALTNVLFAAPGAKLLEIFPPGIAESSFFTAATYSSMKYSYFVADKAGAHMTVDTQKLARLLQLNAA
jgi:capsular polysaccharide biosynthesis protein